MLQVVASHAACPSPYVVTAADVEGIYGIASKCGCTGSDAFKRIIDMNKATLMQQDANGEPVIWAGMALVLPDDCAEISRSDVIAIAVGLSVGIPALAVAIWAVVAQRRGRLCH